jgi:hypothetical protein
MIPGTCDVCGSNQLAYGNCFLIVENPWQDRLRIAHWEHRLAADPEVSHACCAAHVRELLMRWVTRQEPHVSSDFSIQKPDRSLHSIWELAGQLQPIGELAVHRHALRENPEMTNSVLDAVCMAIEGLELQVSIFAGPTLFSPPLAGFAIPRARSASA